MVSVLNANALDDLKCEAAKLSDRQNNLQIQLENLKTTKVTEASPSSPKYSNFEHFEKTTPTATFVD